MNVLTIRPRESKSVRDSLILVLKYKFKNQDNIKFKSYIDSLTIAAMEKEMENVSNSIKALKKNLICIFPIVGDISILKYKDKEIALHSTYRHIEIFNDVIEKKRCESLDPIRDLKRSPKSFDKVVLGNSYSGNHYVGGYTPYGYNYIEMTIGSEHTKFKANNINNGDGVCILHESNDTLLLYGMSKLYYATLKK